MKICYKCKIEKELNEFHKKGNSFQSMCKECRKQYIREHYIKNKLKYKSKAKRNDKRRLEEYKELKKTLKCELCDEKRWWVLEFHHEGKKDFNIASSIKRFSKERIELEIKKCKVLCANCHRDLHYYERNGLKESYKV
jgi:hypothetical protein